MLFDWHMLYPLHIVILDNAQVFGGVLCKAQLCNFSKWFFSPRFGVVPIWELWQFCYVRIEPPKIFHPFFSFGGGCSPVSHELPFFPTFNFHVGFFCGGWLCWGRGSAGLFLVLF